MCGRGKLLQASSSIPEVHIHAHVADSTKYGNDYCLYTQAESSNFHMPTELSCVFGIHSTCM